ncbi:MAG: hypothetical protein Q9168_007490, partial [Polycauliona sp. 1 TL-2023]
MRQIKLKALFCPPNIYEQLLQEPDGLELAKNLDFAMYAGGPLTTATGSALSKIIDVCGFYGSTETTPLQMLVPAREDWDTIEFHPLCGADMQPSVDEAYELVLHRDSKFEGIRGLDNNFPDIDIWRTKDLFRPHASNPNLWRFHRRTDDIIVLSNGEKFNPVPSEAIINSHPLVSAALVVGQGRFQAALLVEPVNTDKSESSLIDEIWPTIENANAQAQGHGRIIRTMIVLAEPSKPFERAGKGTVVRKLTVAKYEAEIEALYSDDRVHKIKGAPTLSKSDDINAVKDFLCQTIDLSFPIKGIEGTDDLYVRGLDSLKTLEIISLLKTGLGNMETGWLSSQLLYTNPTIDTLTNRLYECLNPNDEGQSDPIQDVRIEEMQSLVEKYTRDLKAPTHSEQPLATSKCFALTGSTGSLGKRLLLDLLKSPQVSKVYCLDRRADAASQHPELKQQPLPVEFLVIDYSRSDLGLSTSKYAELAGSIDTLIYAAWKVDFNHSLASFSPIHLTGLRNIIDLSLSSSRRPSIVFISSASSVSCYPHVHSDAAVVPEYHIPNHAAAQQMGYAESKNVAEHILYESARKVDLSSTILRVGQIAGTIAPTSTGMWNPNEWVPALIRSSKSMGYLPKTLPFVVDWIPVDTLSRIIVELALLSIPLSSTMTQPIYYNLVNPLPVSWSTLLPTIQACLGTSSNPSHSPIRTIELREWISRLQSLDAEDQGILERYPAIKILPFFVTLAENGGS